MHGRCILIFGSLMLSADRLCDIWYVAKKKLISRYQICSFWSFSHLCPSDRTNLKSQTRSQHSQYLNIQHASEGRYREGHLKHATKSKTARFFELYICDHFSFLFSYFTGLISFFCLRVNTNRIEQHQFVGKNDFRGKLLRNWQPVSILRLIYPLTSIIFKNK